MSLLCCPSSMLILIVRCRSWAVFWRWRFCSRLVPQGPLRVNERAYLQPLHRALSGRQVRQPARGQDGCLLRRLPAGILLPHRLAECNRTTVVRIFCDAKRQCHLRLTDCVGAARSPQGSYCAAGVGAPTLCPMGRFGLGTGLSLSTCSGFCAAVSLRCSSVPVSFQAGLLMCVSVLLAMMQGRYGDAQVRKALPPAATILIAIIAIRAGVCAWQGLTSSTCSGACRAGYLCAANTLNYNDTAQQCGRGY